jgi:hypothetical protein
MVLVQATGEWNLYNFSVCENEKQAVPLSFEHHFKMQTALNTQTNIFNLLSFLQNTIVFSILFPPQCWKKFADML